MERINDIGVNPVNIYSPISPANKGGSQSHVSSEAVYVGISGAGKARNTAADKTEMLKILGPIVSEEYSDLILSVSEATGRTQEFIERVAKVDLYA